MNCNCVAYDYCLICLSKRSGAVPFMHKVVYDDYCIYWNRDALYHNFWRRTWPLWWSLELARAQPLLWTKRASQSSSEKSGNYMAQTTLQLLLVFEEREESWRCSSLSCILLSVEMCIWWILLWVWAAKWISMVTTLWRRLFVFDKLDFLFFSSM